jgi:hypothetical protein
MARRGSPPEVTANHRSVGKSVAMAWSTRAVPTRPSPAGATLSFYTVIGCHWLPFLRDLHSSLAAIAAISCRNDSVALG